MTTEMLTDMGRKAKAAARALARTDSATRSAALQVIADRLIAEQAEILAANAFDVTDAKAAGLSPAMVDRLLLTAGRVEGIVADVRRVADLPDPVGQVIE